MDTDIIRSDDFESAIKSVTEAENAIREIHEQVSREKTPQSQIKNFAGFDYVTEGFIRSKLNFHYPVWSWEPAGQIQFLGSELVATDGVLVILDKGITRKFYSPGAARIQFKSGMPHTPENVIDIDNNIAASNTNAFKRAANRIGNIADDVYRKVIEDYDLTEEEISALKDIAEEAGPDTLKVIVGKLKNGDIDKTNYERFTVVIKKRIARNNEVKND